MFLVIIDASSVANQINAAIPIAVAAKQMSSGYSWTAQLGWSFLVVNAQPASLSPPRVLQGDETLILLTPDPLQNRVG
jgi:hypothetical protein